MCGIFGYVGELDRIKAQKALNKLAHRGPDGEGLWSTPKVTLGHRRLAILDLSENGKQPMSSPDGRYIITYNGEIYNFLEIREELIKLGYKFKSESDTEVIITAFTEWKEKCLDRFNGMWALAIWDNEEQALFLSRDRFGKKPLFYAELDNGDLVFASEMKAITPLLPKIVVDQSIIDNLAHIFYYESTDKCLLKNIKRFPAGHYGWFKNGKLILTRWWCTLDHLVDVPETYEEQVKKFQELFLDACRLRMRSDVPIGTALSGGLDSSAVFGAIAKSSSESGNERSNKSWQHAFAASFPNTPLDELVWAEKVADFCDTRITPVVIKPEERLDSFYDDVYRFEELYITPHIPFVATYGAMKKAGVSVTLDGHGADELFGGYSFDYLHIIHDELWHPRRVWQVINTYYDSQIKDEIQFGSLPPRWLFFLKQYAKNLAKNLLRRHNSHPDSKHPNWSKLDYFTQKLYISFHQTVLPTLLRNYDRYSMTNGVEIRMPFLDHRIVCYAFSLSWQAKIRGGYTKAIVRDAVADLIPKEVAYRKTKIGFNAPMVNWFQGSLKTFFLNLINEENFEESQIIKGKAVKAEILKVINNQDTTFHQAEHAWQMIAPYLWAKGFLAKINHER